MEFGKVPDTRGIDFKLPPDDPATEKILAAAATQASKDAGFRAYVGCPVWQDDAMARKLCPKGTPKNKRLHHYARQFNVLELNSTGYGLDAERVRRWTAETPSGFRFIPKAPRDITLTANLDGVWDLYAAHCADVEQLGDRLGPLLLQFPESFGPNRFGELERFLAANAKRLPSVLEVRNALWFRDRSLSERLFALLESHGIPSVITDTPGRRDVLHQRLTMPVAFIRFNGFKLGRQDPDRVETWAARVAHWKRKGLRAAYFIPHIDPVDETVELAAHFIASLNKFAGLNLREPRLEQDLEEPRLAL